MTSYIDTREKKEGEGKKKKSLLPALKEEQIIWTPGRGRSVNFVGLGLQIEKQLNNFLIGLQKISQYLRNKAQKDKIKYEGTDGCPSINNFV